MTDREKLVDILKAECCPYPYLCDEGCRYASLPRCFEERYADHLLANGVTFATDNHVGGKWIPVTERLPEVGRRVLVTDGENVSFGYVLIYEHKDCNPWCVQFPCIYDEVTHWMPLPEPPKEGE